MRFVDQALGHRDGRRAAAVALAGLLVLAAPLAVGAAHAVCGDGLPNATRTLIETGGLTLAFAPRPAPIAVGRHFSIDVVVCAASNAPAPALVRVDAEMPAHRHGMNYRAAIHPLDGDRYAVDGLMFHMPGRWRFLFTLGRDRGGQTTLAHEIEIE